MVKRERKAYVRAWTVDKEYRGRGIGSSLLEQGVRVAWGRGARGVGFEEGIIRKLNPFNTKDMSYHYRLREVIGTDGKPFLNRLSQSPPQRFQCCFRGTRGQSEKAVRRDGGGGEEGEE